MIFLYVLARRNIILRYQFVSHFSENLVDKLHLRNLINFNINLAENLSYKLATYNLDLDWVVRKYRIRNYGELLLRLIKYGLRFKHLTYSINLVKRLLKDDLTDLSYEVKLLPSEKKAPLRMKYENIIFSTMNNYLNPLIPLCNSLENYLLILPKESKNWINYRTIKEKEINHIFIEDIVNINNLELVRLKERIIKNYYKNRKKIIFFKYDLRFKEQRLKRFIQSFLPQHLLIIRGLEDFLSKSSLKDTNFYIARDRRALENSFVQIANKINKNTYMVMHGTISSYLKKHLWNTGRFKTCKTIFIWGQHDKELITLRQKLLTERQPNLVICGKSFRKVIKHISNKWILFLCQATTYRYLPLFAKTLKDYNIVARLHPADRHSFTEYKKYERPNFHIEDPKTPLSESLSKASLVICHSSTAVLDAVFNKIPTLFINFIELRRTYPLIYSEVPIKKRVLQDVLLYKKDFKKKIIKVLNDDGYKKKVLTINQEIFNYFVELPKKEG